MYRYMGRFFDKLCDALSTVWGWCVAVGVVLADFISGYEMSVQFVVIVTMLDAVWGIAVSVKRKKFALSELGRDTIGKIAVYGTALVSMIMVDKQVALDTKITTSIIAAAIILVELWSCCANALIIFPNMPFLRLMQPVLTGEIARKLNMDEKDVKAALGGKADSGKEEKDDGH